MCNKNDTNNPSERGLNMLNDTLFKDWLTVIDAAKVLNCTEGCARQMVHRGKFPNCIKVRNLIMIPLSDINNFKEDKERRKNKRKAKFVVPQRDLGL